VPILSAVFDSFCSALALVMLGICAFGLGRPLLRWLPIVPRGGLAVLLWSLATGIGAGGTILLLVARGDGLHPLVLAALGIVACSSAGIELARWLVNGAGDHWHSRRRRFIAWLQAVTSAPKTSYAVGALAAVSLTAAFVTALAPPAADQTLARSLEVPRTLLLRQGFEHATATTALPNLADLWFLWSLAIEGPVTANLAQWGTGLLLALATALLARPFVGTPLALVAAGLVLLCPAVQSHMSAPDDELLFAFFTTMAVVAACQVLVQGESIAWAVLCGGMLGSASAVRLTAIPFGIALAIVWARQWRDRQEARPELAMAGRLALLSALVAAAPWLLLARPQWEGNPPTASTVSLFAIGPLLLAMLPGLVFARKLRGLGLLLTLLLVYGVLTVAFSDRPCSLLPLIPLAATAAAWVWQEMPRLPSPTRQLATGALAVSACVAPMQGCWQMASRLPVAIGLERREDYLLARDPTYRAASLFNQICRPDQSVLCQDARNYYFAAPTAVASEGRGRRDNISSDLTPRQAVELARQSGHAYVLLAQKVDTSPHPGIAPLAAELAPARVDAPTEESDEGGEVIPILEYRFADDNNRCIRYRLLKLR